MINVEAHAAHCRMASMIMILLSRVQREPSLEWPIMKMGAARQPVILAPMGRKIETAAAAVRARKIRKFLRRYSTSYSIHFSNYSTWIVVFRASSLTEVRVVLRRGTR